MRTRQQKVRSLGQGQRRGRRATKKQDAEMEIAASPSLAYLSKADVRRHIHDGLQPYQRLADQAGMHFLSYLIAMAVDEAGGESERRDASAGGGEGETG
jgi:hypothetical protein